MSRPIGHYLSAPPRVRFEEGFARGGRFQTACRVLGLERINRLTIHHGRHTFISHALAGGRTLAEVRDAAGHSNVSVTSAYLHVAVDGEQGTGELLGF